MFNDFTVALNRERSRRLESVKSHLSPFDVIFMRTPLGTIGVFRSARARRVVVIVEWYEVGTKHFSVSAKSDLSACVRNSSLRTVESAF